MMKILYIGRCPPHRSGVAIQHSLLINRLADNGHSIQSLDPITPKSSPNSGGYTWRMHEGVRHLDHYKCSYDTTASNPGTLADRQRYAAYMGELLPQLIARETPDLILLGGEYFAHGVAGIARQFAVPSILSATGPFAAFFRGVSPREIGEDLLADARQVDVVVACAKHMARDLRAAGLSNVELIQNYVDTDKFADGVRDQTLMRRLQLEHDDVLVLHISNLTSPKRVLDLAAAAQPALQRDPRLLFIIVGDGPERPALEEACARNGVSGRFRFVGWVDHGQVADFIRICDVVVLPSETEGLALAYLEAQASERVILASDIPAAREVIAHGQTGLLFRKGDVSDLVEKLILATSGPALRAQIGVRARTLVRDHYAFSDAVRKYERLFERVIGSRRPL
jgi:glycosyltransferase involved in cell wall biosynthesis